MKQKPEILHLHNLKKSEETLRPSTAPAKINTIVAKPSVIRRDCWMGVEPIEPLPVDSNNAKIDTTICPVKK